MEKLTIFFLKKNEEIEINRGKKVVKIDEENVENVIISICFDVRYLQRRQDKYDFK